MFSSCLLIIKKKKNKRDIWYLFRFLFFSNLNCISHFIIDNRVISYLWNKFWIIKSLIINNNNDNFKIRGEWFNGIQWSHKDYVIIYFFSPRKNITWFVNCIRECPLSDDTSFLTIVFSSHDVFISLIRQEMMVTFCYYIFQIILSSIYL